MLKAFNFIVIRPPKLHIIMYSSFPTFLDCGIDIMWRHYEVMIAEFFTEPTGEPTGNRKVERIHSVNFPYIRVWMTAPPPSLIWSLYPPLDGVAKERAYPLSCLTTSKIEMSTQDGIIFKDPKCVISISTRPKDKEKPNNNVSVGKDAWSCVLTQHEQRTEINFLKVWNLQNLFKLPNKRNLLFEPKTGAALIEKVKRRFV